MNTGRESTLVGSEHRWRVNIGEKLIQVESKYR